jgi:hypothetical protein
MEKLAGSAKVGAMALLVHTFKAASNSWLQNLCHEDRAKYPEIK